MSGKGSKKHKSSLFSRFKKRVSSKFFPSSPASSRQRSPLPSDSTGRLDAPGHYADTQLAPESLSHRPSVSGFSAHSAANSIPRHPSPPSHQRPAQYLEDSVCQDPSSTHLAPSSSLQYPQGQASTFQGPNHTFSGAHDFVMNYPVFVDNSTTADDSVMKELLQETIIGAEFDSSARDPPPRCHPGTRLAIIQRCLDFIAQCHDEEKLRWVVGPAGVGKSAIMQMVTEQAPDGVILASVFLSVNGRRDGSKAILTIAYQLAVKCGPYRQFVRDQISLDPSLLRKSLSVQFNKFIVEPFMLNSLFEPSRRSLIVIDGLDECDSPSTQEELLELITDFCITYPTSSVAWIVASRPEPHITSFFDQAKVTRAYTKEEIVVDSDEACEDVQQYLRDELKKIQLKYPTLKRKREWPLEYEFTRIASSAGGLFAYAVTVVRYIGDPHYRDPAAQLRSVLETAGTKGHIPGNDHPMAQLDALYKSILSSIPDRVMTNTRKLLLMLSMDDWTHTKFRQLSNMLGLTEDDAYGAIRHLYAVMKIPELDKVDEESLSFHHKSFKDFLFDSTRSGFSDDLKNEAKQLCAQASLRIVGEVPCDSDGVASGEDITFNRAGSVKGCCDNITLSWPGDECFQMNNHELRIKLYSGIMYWLCHGFARGVSPYRSISWFHALTTRFTAVVAYFPIYELRGTVFDEFRDELTELGKLKQVPFRALDYAAIFGIIQLQFTSPIETDVELSDPWKPSCEYDHKQKEIDGLQQRRGWSTKFAMSRGDYDEDINLTRFGIVKPRQTHKKCFNYYRIRDCTHCSGRLARHLLNCPDLLATVFVDATQMSYVELSFVDPDDGVSEWRYRFCHSGRPTSIDA